MAIEKPMEPSDLDIEGTDAEEVEVQIVNPDAVSIGTDDGGMIIDFEGSLTEELVGPEHDANLAEFIDEAVLQSMASELVGDFESDRASRRDWARAYVKGLDLLGMKIEERSQPWQGASGVFHPVLTEAVVRFQAQAMGELFPASGPVRTKIMGKLTPEKTDQADRIQTEMNYLLTEEMTEYRDETEQMLFKLPLAGSAFKKVYYDPLEDRPVAMFVPAEDFVASYGASDLASCPRYTHIMKKTSNEILELHVAGFYRDVDLPDPEPDFSDIHEKYDEAYYLQVGLLGSQMFLRDRVKASELETQMAQLEEMRNRLGYSEGSKKKTVEAAAAVEDIAPETAAVVESAGAAINPNTQKPVKVTDSPGEKQEATMMTLGGLVEMEKQEADIVEDIRKISVNVLGDSIATWQWNDWQKKLKRGEEADPVPKRRSGQADQVYLGERRAC